MFFPPLNLGNVPVDIEIVIFGLIVVVLVIAIGVCRGK